MTLAAASLLLPHISRNLASTSKDVSFSDESYKANIASEAPSFWCGFSFAGMGKPWAQLVNFSNFCHGSFFTWPFSLHCGEIQFCCLELKEGTSSLFSVCLILIGGC
uniref:Uncharacterized protein n=1 Tax=Setaria viridis TaxID=4556 RepID=A0A4U6TE36_SETVI|nr:hypothetical protein SEVIR_9G364100v2 [Setaria viridis]